MSSSALYTLPLPFGAAASLAAWAKDLWFSRGRPLNALINKQRPQQRHFLIPFIRLVAVASTDDQYDKG